MLQDYRWSTLYKGFTITQRNNGIYYAAAYTYDTMSNTNKSKISYYPNIYIKLYTQYYNSC